MQTLLADATAAMLSGKNRVVSSAGAGDANVTHEWQLDNKLFWEELNWALEEKSSAYARGTTRTQIRYV